LDLVISIWPWNEELYSERARVKFYLNDFEGSLADLNTIFELFTKLKNDANKEVGIDKESGFDDFDEDELLDFDLESAYFERAIVKYKLNDYSGAIEDYTEAIAIDPNFFFAYSGRAEVKLELKDYSGAIKDSTLAIKIDSRWVEAFIIRGKAKMELRNFKGAVADFKRATKINPDLAEGYNYWEIAKNTTENLNKSDLSRQNKIV
jgi:tetratricopeptide (TPR) repeat protein